ncbi:hypothetical protein [Phaeospirillum tilakii]|uniref:Uncharacterized protein n=1 Tax=Phaeospirillum tilakii TaxID=741673 RepID=A0ABW5CBM7_9PROT
MPDQPIHLFVAAPCYGGLVTTHFAVSLIKLQRACIDQGLTLSFSLLGGDALIPRARANLVQRFLEIPDATHLLFVDADIGFEPEQVFGLLAAGKDFCGALYPLKKLNWDLIGEMARDGIPDIESNALNYVVEFLDQRPAPVEGEMMRVRALGGGFMMLTRAAVTRLIAAHPDLRFALSDVRASRGDTGDSAGYALFDPIIDPDSGTYLSEDYALCKRWRDIGGEIWASLRSRLTHCGSHSFIGDPALLMAIQRLPRPEDR